MKYFVLVLPLMLGCAEMMKYNDQIDSAGKLAEEAAPVITAFNPEIGLIVAGVSVLLLGIGKLLKKSGKN